MKKIKSCFLACIALLLYSAAFSQASTDKEYFTKKVSYKVSGVPNAATANYKVDAYKNVIKIVCNGKLFSALELSTTPKGGPGPLPPGPNPCAPGRCYPITFNLEGTVITVTINGSKSPIQVKEARGSKAFTEALKKAPNQQIVLSEPQIQR